MERFSWSSCPPIVEYDRRFRDKTAEEIKKLPQNSNIEQMLDDYNLIREQLRICYSLP